MEVLPQPPGPVAAVLAFSGHHVVAADIDPAWVAARVPDHDFGAPLAAPFLEALAAELGRTYDNVDLVLAAPALAGPPPLDLAPADDDVDHHRLDRARRYRTEVQAWQVAGGTALLVLGRGLAGRWEAAYEVRPEARGRGLGRALTTAARHLVPAGEHVFVQVAPGNAASVRAVLGAGGYLPIGGEVLFAPHP